MQPKKWRARHSTIQLSTATTWGTMQSQLNVFDKEQNSAVDGVAAYRHCSSEVTPYY